MADSLLKYDSSATGKTQGDGAQTIAPSGMSNAKLNQICVRAGTATTGTIAVTVLPHGQTAYESLLDPSGAAITISIASPVSYVFSGIIDGIKLTPSGLDGTYQYTITGAE